MLDAEAAKVDWHEVARVVLKIDPDKEFARAKRMYDTHLARANWMTERAYKHLLMEADEWRILGSLEFDLSEIAKVFVPPASLLG